MMCFLELRTIFGIEFLHQPGTNLFGKIYGYNNTPPLIQIQTYFRTFIKLFVKLQLVPRTEKTKFSKNEMNFVLI